MTAAICSFGCNAQVSVLSRIYQKFLTRQQNLWIQKRTPIALAKNAKELTLLFLKTIDHAGNPVFHVRLADIE